MFYTYLWLREDGTPYYVGKGKGQRAYRNGCPTLTSCDGYLTVTDFSRIIIQEQPCEEEAFEVEKFFISHYGRKDLGTGCLRNLTDGGEGPAGHMHSAAHKKSISLKLTGRVVSEETGRKISESKKGKVVHSIEQRLAASKRLKGTTWSEERRKAQPSGKKEFCLNGHARIPENLSGGNCRICLRAKALERKIKAGLPTGRRNPPSQKGKKWSEQSRQAFRIVASKREAKKRNKI